MLFCGHCPHEVNGSRYIREITLLHCKAYSNYEHFHKGICCRCGKEVEVKEGDGEME
jgi:hypothetical protein